LLYVCTMVDTDTTARKIAAFLLQIKADKITTQATVYMGFGMEVTYLLRQQNFSELSRHSYVYQAGIGKRHRGAL